MNITLKLLTAAAVISIATPSMAADATYESSVKIKKSEDGDVTKKVSEEAKDAAGTKTTAETKSELDVSKDGDTTKTVTTETTADPKGLGNKTSTKVVDKAKVKDGHMTKEHKKVVNGDTVVDTTTETK